MKITMIQHLSGANSYHIGETYEFSDKEAYNLIKAGIAQAKTAKDFEALEKKIEAIKDEELEKEKKLAALLEKDSLEAEREKLQDRVNAITDILCDAETFYKSYIALASDLSK